MGAVAVEGKAGRKVPYRSAEMAVSQWEGEWQRWLWASAGEQRVSS